MTDEPDAPRPEPTPRPSTNFDFMFAAAPRPETRTIPAVPVFDGQGLTEGQTVSDAPNIFSGPPVFSAPPIAPAPVAATSVTTTDPAATVGPPPVQIPAPTQSFVAQQSRADATPTPIPGAFAFERRPHERQRATSVLDWTAFVLAFILPPIGLLAGIATLVISSRTRGWTSGIGKASVGVAVALSLVLAGGGLVLSRTLSSQQAHDAIVASSVKWCTSLRSDPARLTSDTYGWPATAGTISASLPPMQKYADFWTGLVKIAPAGVKAETQKIASAATGIVTSVQTSRVLDDSTNIAQMQQVVSASTIPAWVSEYCK